MEKNLQENRERRPYVKPEASMIQLALNENIAASNSEFNGEDDFFEEM